MPDTPPLTILIAKGWNRFTRGSKQAARSASFGRAYAIGAVVILLATTLFWAVLGARLQAHNADQLSDPYLFASKATFHGASFPGSHTFLLKWPIFWLLGVVGVSTTSLLVATVGVVLVTVATLALVLYKIDRRPMVFGAVCLGLSLALLLIPAQPYAGGILPVNMAMLTTRNLEYAFYLGSLVLFARAKRIRDWNFAAGVVLLAILIASDKLFLSLSIGGALLALITYALVNNWGLTSYAVRWLAGGVIALFAATGLLFLISALHFTHLANGSAATPYGVVHDGKAVVLGVAYALLGLLTDAGANPVYDNRVLAKLPSSLIGHLWSFSTVAYLTAATLLVVALFAVWFTVRPTMRSRPHGSKQSTANLLSLSLLWSTVAAIGVFVLTTHYYAVDARYLSIGLFALVVTLSVWLRTIRWQWPEDMLVISCFLLVAIFIAGSTALRISHGQTAALTPIDKRNSLIATALERHKVDTLVGDYWRVMPVKLASHGSLNAMPLAGCSRPNTILTSSTWQPDLRHHSFAYLLAFDPSLTGYPKCSPSDVTSKYGIPNATQVIAGTVSHPRGLLLFYDQGIQPSRPATGSEAEATILPIALSALTKTNCSQPTIMNVVAHEDDDILFMNPDLLGELQAGNCVRTVYMTAGDAGVGKLYWLSRQLGAEAAYSTMLGVKNVWEQQTLKIADNEYATVATLQSSSHVSLIFLNLPDGNMHGGGFSDTGFESLQKLYDGAIPVMHAVDGQSSYTSTQLTAALATLMEVYQPARVHTQADAPSHQYPDHSDHIAAGRFAVAATMQYDQQHFGDAVSIPVTRYIGYPIHGYASNVSDAALLQKDTAFLAYAQYDGDVCQTVLQCEKTSTYGTYLTRQYIESP